MAASHSFMAFVAIILAAVVLPLSAKAYDGIAPILVPYAGSLDYSCMPAAPPAPSVIPLNSSLFDPCYWVYCGGGTCTKNKTMTHTCQCNPGYSNLLNITAFPCYSDCALGSDCAKLGIKVSNSTSSSNSNQVEQQGGFRQRIYKKEVNMNSVVHRGGIQKRQELQKIKSYAEIEGDQRGYAELAKGVEVRDNEVECPDEVAQCNVDKLQRDVLSVDVQHRKDISMAGNDSKVSESKLVGTEGSVEKPNGGTSLMIPTKRNESGEVGVEGTIVTPGFVRSCNGSEMVGPSINFQVVLEGAHLRNISNGPRLEAHNLDLDQVNSAGVQPMLSPTWVLPAVTRGEGVQAVASRRKVVVKSNSNQRRMGGLRGKRGRGRKRMQKTQTSFLNGFQGGAVFRAAATALPALIHRVVN
ncbi:hypothetical protein TEA_010672 [Camellia sinensis var. sinensis]|uniref:EGF-like domain-containing protein n=1 Tax=Camellia sinensis var. sinensis TaxID=542762 RepID=A0A4S4E5F3_CAMSN|nr:hypothetical protein TEA_010672 [Camellia sinensis var. sinensis]